MLQLGHLICPLPRIDSNIGIPPLFPKLLHMVVFHKVVIVFPHNKAGNAFQLEFICDAFEVFESEYGFFEFEVDVGEAAGILQGWLLEDLGSVVDGEGILGLLLFVVALG